MVKQGLSVHIRAPPLTLFCLRPEDAPKTQLPGPQNGRKWIQPFGINPTLYNYFLDIGVPATIAVIYLVSVTLLSRLNNSRKNKPWKFSKSSTFKALVLCHNISLALYSGWTFLGLSCTINGNWPSKRDSTFSAQVADSLCRISRSNGPVIARSFMKNNHFPEMPVSILPESSGLWDSGLAYFSWLFYMSKFYEVVDTLIILAKGKSSSILQTYHHAGAMICMWAGVRYMSPPGLVGCLLNSAIHTLMYSYYVLTALALPVAGLVKRTLTSLQIIQFVGGGLAACVFLFVEYDALVYLPSDYNTGLVSEMAKDDTMSFRASGVWDFSQPDTSFQHEDPRYQVRTISCLQNSGQTFALCLTILYLLPLTYLFVRFFTQSYVKLVGYRSD